MDEMDDQELLEALGITIEPKKAPARTLQQERVIAGFETFSSAARPRTVWPPSVR